MPFLPPNQQRQSTEGTAVFTIFLLVAFSALVGWASERASGL